MPCMGQQTEAPTQPNLVNVKCANPFIETIVFRAPSFGNIWGYLPELERNLSSKIRNCAAASKLGLEPLPQGSYEDAYLKVKIKACPEKKKFSYSQVLNCFNLTLQTYKPPEKFGPYYVEAEHYAFHDKGNWLTFLVLFLMLPNEQG
jgi:hypothetical protein